ncbi:hypothetical protein FHS18_001186 [Paenibacillus phyllosphaerae]|uniref:Uncharacterized protein n=1 Tax=Paenibacillus phyllosphaerae TaxID=274593 RepID=A0A7W5AV83_9BACL|nr:hypothetical protein [Paenibacillus phyllosphaerae]MBB3109134.1 hypothetical protein [Paenibacillus phyllosphaerae]
MMNEAIYLAVWLMGLFGIVGVVSWCLARMVIDDSMNYDEQHVWQRKLPQWVKEEKKR